MRRPALTPRLQPFTSTIFAEMTALATKTNAVNLGQGFPDTDGPPSMLAKAQEAIASGINQYPPGPGRPELRAAIAQHRTRTFRASATTACFRRAFPRLSRSNTARAHRLYRSIAQAHCTSSFRSTAGPRLEIRPRRSSSPDWYCRGTSPP